MGLYFRGPQEPQNISQIIFKFHIYGNVNIYLKRLVIKVFFMPGVFRSQSNIYDGAFL